MPAVSPKSYWNLPCVSDAPDAWLNRDDAGLPLLANLELDERNAMPEKLLPPPTQPIHDIRLLAGQLHLLDALLADDGLMQADMVQPRCQGNTSSRNE